MKTFIKTFFTLILTLILEQGLSQEKIINIYSQNENKVYVTQKGKSNCKNPNEIQLRINYKLDNGIVEKYIWLNWKQNFITCDGEILTQEFYAPMCAVWALSQDFFFDSYAGEGNPFNLEFAECLYPSAINKFNGFTSEPYDIKEVQKDGDFLPPSISPVSACNLPSFNLKISDFNSIEINWNGNKDWTNCEIRYRKKGDANWNLVEILRIDAAQNSYTISNLNLDTNYEIEVGSKCSYSKSVYFSTSQIIRTDKSNCPIPKNIEIVHVFGDSLILKWFGDAKGKYLVNYKLKNSSNWDSKLVNTNQASISDLEFDANYEFKVAGFDQYGQGNFSTTTNATTAINPAPSVFNLKTSFIKTNSIQATWEILTPFTSDLYQNNIIYDCIISEKKNPNLVQIKTTKTNFIAFENLQYETEYLIEVQATLLKKYKSEEKEIASLTTGKLTRTVIFHSQNTHRDSLNIILFQQSEAGEQSKRKSFKFQNKGSILTTIEYNSDYKQNPYSIAIEYKNNSFPECSQLIEPGITDTIFVEIKTPPQLLTIFEKSNRAITGYRNKPLSIQIAGGLNSFITPSLANSIVQPDFSINLDFRNLSLSGKTNFNTKQTISDIQLFSNYQNVSFGYSISKRDIEANIQADKRFNIFRVFVYNSSKKIAPKYSVTTQINAGYLSTESNFIHDMYDISNYTQTLTYSQLKVNSIQTGLKVIFLSNYSMSYFQKGIGKKIKNPEMGEEINKYSQLQIGLNFYSPLSGSAKTTSKDGSNNFIDLTSSNLTSGFKFSIEHTYNIRNSNLTLTKGLDFYKANRISNGFESTQKNYLPVFCFSLKLGWSNLR